MELSKAKRVKGEAAAALKSAFLNGDVLKIIFAFAGTQSNDLKTFLWVIRGDHNLHACQFKNPLLRATVLKKTKDGRNMPTTKRASAYAMFLRTTQGKSNPSWWGRNVRQAKDASGKKFKVPLVHNKLLLAKFEQEAYIENVLLSLETTEETKGRRKRSVLMKKAAVTSQCASDLKTLGALKASHSLYWASKDMVGAFAQPFHSEDETLRLTATERTLYITLKETEMLLADAQRLVASLCGKAYAAVNELHRRGINF